MVVCLIGYDPHYDVVPQSLPPEMRYVTDSKIKALMEHASQIDAEELEKWVRPWLAETGKKHDPPVEYAESFRVVRINDDTPPPEGGA